MKKQATYKRFHITPLILALIAIFVLASFFYKSNYYKNSRSNTTYSGSTFSSSYLKFTIYLPSNFTSKDEPSRIYLNSPYGQITISRNGTNYSNIDDYLQEFDKRVGISVLKSEKKQINENDARVRLEMNTNNVKEKVYYIYSNNFVYILFTSNEDLFDDLDQIAQSFRYTP